MIKSGYVLLAGMCSLDGNTKRLFECAMTGGLCSESRGCTVGDRDQFLGRSGDCCSHKPGKEQLCAEERGLG